MGQNSSIQVEDILSTFTQLLNSGNTNPITSEEIKSVSYENFLNYLGELNKLSNKSVNESQNGTQLLFAVRKGTDSTIFWKQTVEIACIKYDFKKLKACNMRLLNLKEFLQVFKTLQDHYSAIEQSNSSKDGNSINVSAIFDKIGTSSTSGDINTECCICLERKPDVLLPCAHSYCNECIEEWNEVHDTCPICREKLESTDDTWVLSEVPGAEEISQEIKSTLIGLTESKSSSCTPF